MIKNNFRHTIYACYLGYITQAVINNLAPLLFLIFHDAFGIELSKITLIITVNFMVQLGVDFISAYFVDKIGYRRCMVAAHIFAALGIGSMAYLPFVMNPFTGLLISSTLYAIGGGLLEVLVSPIVEACPTKNKASVMSLLHSFYCWGTVGVVIISTLFLHVFGRDSWRELVLLWIILPLFNSLYFTQVPIAPLVKDSESMSIGELLKSRMFLLFALLMVCAGASEQGMSQWASAFAEKGLGISKTAGDLAGACMFSVLMGVARVFYAKVGERYDLMPFLKGSALLCIVSYLIAALSPLPAVSLIGCALCGLSVGIMWPGVFSIAAARCPAGGTAMFALLALAGDLGCSSGPTLVGFVSGAAGDNLNVGLICAIVFPTVMLASLAIRNSEIGMRN